MADAKKCDICGAYCSVEDAHYRRGEYGLFIKCGLELSKLDMCPGCRTMINDFVESIKRKKDV